MSDLLFGEQPELRSPPKAEMEAAAKSGSNFGTDAFSEKKLLIISDAQR